MNFDIKWKNEIYPYFEDEIIRAIEKLPTSFVTNMSEVRFRSNGYVSISVGANNKILTDENKKPIKYDKEKLCALFLKICEDTIHKYEAQIKSGYITIKGGHRVGFCGTAIYENNCIINVSQISSISFRISRVVLNSAKNIISYIVSDNRVNSTLIVSEPCGGKTTILTDLARLLSNLGIRSSVIDERGEICGVYDGVAQKDIGVLTDVFDGYLKGDGMLEALRSLSPQVIICDEIGSSRDVDAMLEAMNAGVPTIATAHATNEKDLFKRPQIERLINSGGVDKIIFLKGSSSPGTVRKVIDVCKYDENYWSSDIIA